MKIGFIGAGNMGGALAVAAAKGGAEVLLCDRDSQKADALAAQIGANACDIQTIVAQSDCIFLGVKPQQLTELLGELAQQLSIRSNKPVLVSMAAGVQISEVQRMAGGTYPTVRIMPNLPVSVGEGMVLYCHCGVDSLALSALLDCMQYAGRWDELDEKLIDAGCALSGCGPAFVYKFIDALAEGAIECGLPSEKATEYAIMTVKGAAALALNSDKSPDRLCKAVCSPAGSTIEGVKSLDADCFDWTVKRAVAASYKRTVELGKSK